MIFRSLIITLAVFLAIFPNVSLAQETDWIDDDTPDTSNELETDTAKIVEGLGKVGFFNEKAKNDMFNNFLSKKQQEKKAFGYNDHLFPVYHTVTQKTCCEMKFQIKDFGVNHYPRYVQVGICKANSCGKKQRCVEKKNYKVWILRKKFEEDTLESKNVFFLPEPFKSLLVFEIFNTSVACECVTVFK